MIWPTDAAVLAITKLRTRRFRHAIVIFTSSILFIAISAILFLVRGTINSIEGFMEDGLASRYIISAVAIPYEDTFYNKEIISRAKEIQKAFINQKITEAKKLNIGYEPNSEPSVASSSNDGINSYEMLIDLNYYPVAQAIKEYYSSKNIDYSEELKKLGSDYGVKAVYRENYVRENGDNLYLQILEDGKESYDTPDDVDYFGSDSLSSFSQNYSLLSADLLEPFVLKGENLEIDNDGTLPILVPYSAAQKLLKLKELDNNADAKRKSDYLTELREKALGFKFDVCYRNSTSYDLLTNAKIESQEYNKNKDKKDYIKPDYVIDLPKENCGASTVLRDVRNKEQKDFDDKQNIFDQKFGKEPDEQSLLKYRIVGILPSVDNSSFSLQQLLQSVITSSVGNGWVSPLEIREKNAIISKLTPASNTLGDERFFAEFNDVDSAKRFMNEKNCIPDYNVISTTMGENGALMNCVEEGKLFVLSPYGANSIAISEFKTRFYSFFNYAMLYMGILASIILLGVVSRVIADSRRETAVFRAIGAKRIDIAQIYLTYVFMIAILISVVSTLAAVLVGVFLQNRYASDLSLSTSVTFNLSGSQESIFKIYEVVPRDLLLILLTIFVACIFSALIPILTNVRRNPISDMRDER